MSIAKKRNYLVGTEEGASVRYQLQQIDMDSAFNTSASYSANTTLYANNSITFVDKHMAYLNNNPHVNPDLYLSNLRLITRIRP